MSRRLAVVLLALAFLLPAPFAFAETVVFAGREDDGNELLSLCEHADESGVADSSEEMLNGMYCIGFVAGIINTNSAYAVMLGNVSPSLSPLFCPPNEFTSGQGIKVVVKYLREHPEKLHERAAGLAFEALGIAFPCPPLTPAPR